MSAELLWKFVREGHRIVLGREQAWYLYQNHPDQVAFPDRRELNRRHCVALCHILDLIPWSVRVPYPSRKDQQAVDVTDTMEEAMRIREEG